jgi:hypothetical protein
MWGAALGAWTAARAAPSPRARNLRRVLALVLAVLPFVWRPAVPDPAEGTLPPTAAGRIQAVRRFSYRSPETVARLLPLSRDADAAVRARATLALGVNLIVSDIENDRAGFPSRHASHPLRDSLRLRLIDALSDPVEEVRIEAARALWNAPRAFGTQPAAAETLSLLLLRRASLKAPGRLAWLALDAAAGVPDSGLRAAAAVFAASTRDTALARAAHAALDGRAVKAPEHP